MCDFHLMVFSRRCDINNYTRGRNNPTHQMIYLTVQLIMSLEVEHQQYLMQMVLSIRPFKLLEQIRKMN